MCTLREAVYSDDPPWNGAGAAIWSVIELNCAIICASLPTLRPLIAKVVPGMSSNNSNYASYERYGSHTLLALTCEWALTPRLRPPEGAREALALKNWL